MEQCAARWDYELGFARFPTALFLSRDTVRVEIVGRVIDENYSRVLIETPDGNLVARMK